MEYQTTNIISPIEIDDLLPMYEPITFNYSKLIILVILMIVIAFIWVVETKREDKIETETSDIKQ